MAITVMHKLLVSNLYGSIHLINFLDILFSFIQYFEYNSDVNVEFQRKLKRKINFPLIDIGKIISKLPDNANLSFITFESLKPFVMDAINLIKVSKETLKGLVEFISGFLKYVNKICTLQEIGNVLDDFIVKCVETVKRLVLDVDSDDKMYEFIAQLFIFIKKTKGSS